MNFRTCALLECTMMQMHKRKKGREYECCYEPVGREIVRRLSVFVLFPFQVCNAVYVRLNWTQPLCACPSRYRDPCSASLNSDDLHTTELITDPNMKVTSACSLTILILSKSRDIYVHMILEGT